eukprot:TRINITY_DN2198_c7_g1_i1.p1 TRINITY_DN2198_c7_g1~~TRINITY_DN2198_c7_g1_i1.p1  ORF type:complete len:395 (+),score=14.72 TRINITY_DN2198_c7_g1_i1:41-1186(+)
MPPCNQAWQYGETEMPSWVHDEMYMALAGIGFIAAALQVATSWLKGFRSMAHKGLQLIAAGDMVLCLWWIVVARHTVGDGHSWYSKEGTCRFMETIRISTEVCGVFWTAMLCYLAALDACHFYRFEVVPRQILKAFVALFFIVPLIQVTLVVWWKLKSPCPSQETSTTEEAAEHVLTIFYLVLFTTASICCVYVFTNFRSKRTGVAPRILFLPLSIALRGVAPLLTFYGWLRLSCTHDWAGLWSVVSPLMPMFNLVVFFCRTHTLQLLSAKTDPLLEPTNVSRQTPTPNYNTCSSSAPASHSEVNSDRTSILDLPLRIQQMHLDFLWGVSSQVLLFERRVRNKGIHRGRSSAGSSYINSEPCEDDEDCGEDYENPRASTAC